MKLNGPLALFLVTFLISFQLHARLTPPEEVHQNQIQSEQQANLLSRCIAGVVKEGYALAFAQDICGRVFSQNTNDNSLNLTSSCTNQLSGSVGQNLAHDLCLRYHQTQNQNNGQGNNEILKVETMESQSGAEI